MKKIKKISLVIFLFAFSGLSFSQSESNYIKSDLKEKIINQESGFQTNNNLFKKNLGSISKNDPREKSPVLGAVLSGLLPGTGEFYGKNYLKAAIFFAIEVGLWTAYAVYENKGDDQTDYYKGFADKNWSINKYAQWLVDQQFTGFGSITDPQTSDHNRLRREVNIVEAQNFSHQLPPFGDQQYYELIGKYQNFVVGWADADPTISKNSASPNYYGTYSTAMFKNYAVDRQTANDYYNKANASIAVVILNHLVSAADAAWTVSMFNKDLKVKTGMNFRDVYGFYGEKKLTPFANVNVTF
ncbi:MAG TPA: hypothetical protein PK536_12125 [Ignavibacteria bacterium]|nr:hypothetical protein [Ignavibacteria bacterium]HRK00635.1 hypothetical protein [Ignavibacteria bacterium]